MNISSQLDAIIVKLRKESTRWDAILEIKMLKDDILSDNPYVYLHIDPFLDPFRDETQFIELLDLYNINKNNSL